MLRAANWPRPFASKGSKRRRMQRRNLSSSKRYQTATKSGSSWRPAAGQRCQDKRPPIGWGYKVAPLLWPPENLFQSARASELTEALATNCHSMELAYDNFRKETRPPALAGL